MQLSISSALAAFLIAGDVFVNAACPSRLPSGLPSGFPSGFPTGFPSGLPTGFPSGATRHRHTSSPVAPSSYQVSTLRTSVVPVASLTTTSPAAPVVTPVTTSSSSSSSAAAATTAAASTDSSLTSDQTSALDTQNSARSDVGEAALAWDATLATNAQTWADHLASLNSPGTLVHSTDSGEGENLYWQSNSDSPYANAASAWVAEKSSYSGEAISDDASFENYGHYTQIIWASTTKVGMAVASDGQGGYYVVARYSPQGNIIGETPTDS